jgi:hypothetical protein
MFIGTLANYLAMKRINTRGLTQANKCMLMAAVAYNLKKLLNYKTPKVQAMIKKLPARLGKWHSNLAFALTVRIGHYNRRFCLQN